jgi:hypothetical protein
MPCYDPAMHIARSMLFVSTPLGVAGDHCEAWRLAGGLVFLMAMRVATAVGHESR